MGGTFFDNNVHFGSGLTFEANYARRVLGTGFASISVEVPFVFNWDEELRSDAAEIPQDLKMYFLTPSARLNFFSEFGRFSLGQFRRRIWTFQWRLHLIGVPTRLNHHGSVTGWCGIRCEGLPQF